MLELVGNRARKGIRNSLDHFIGCVVPTFAFPSRSALAIIDFGDMRREVSRTEVFTVSEAPKSAGDGRSSRGPAKTKS